MSTITADPAMQSILSQMKDVTEIRDANGNLMGIYTPKGMTDEEIRKLFDLNKARATFEREKDKGRPFREIIAKLRKLEQDGAAKPKKRTRKPA